MALTIGTQLGSHEITALLGKGGMGEVYRARDLKLKREVAIKMLPSEFSSDPERMSRFQREAEALASLNHPNIAAIYDLQEASGTQYLVLELLEGETLRECLAHGALPMHRAADYALQMSRGLAAAHEKGVIHRDLKPENMFVTHDGRIKILDFGLAKFKQPTFGEASSNAPTNQPVTVPGFVLGTAGYMSPEQVRGQEIDQRSDIFSFGVILYEMLTGKRAFHGPSTVELLNAILKEEPPLSGDSEQISPAFQRLLMHCIEKDARMRFQSANDLAFALETATTQSGSQAAARARTRSRFQRVSIVLAAAAFTMIALAGVLAVRTDRIEPREIRMQVNTPPTQDPISFAISPDGQRLAFVANNDGKPQLWIRPLDSFVAQLLPGTEGATYPFWSPDSSALAFFAGGKLKRIDIAGGAPQTICSVAIGFGGSWNQNGVVIFTSASGGPIHKVAATGGESQIVPGPETVIYRFPQFLPDGKHFIYTSVAPVPGIYEGSLDSPGSKRLADATTAAFVSPAGFLFFLREGTLFGQRFDFARDQLSGNPFPIAEQVVTDQVYGSGFSVAAGVIAYRTRGSVGGRQLVWFDRSGKSVGNVGGIDSNGINDVELSPDGKHIATQTAPNGNVDIWLLDVSRNVPTRFTFDPAIDAQPVWSSDGSHVIFTSTRNGNVFRLYQKLMNMAGADELLLGTDQIITATDSSPDGRYILFRSVDPKNDYDLWILPTFGDKKPFLFLQTPYDERDGQFSPDGRWIAYQSNESGRFEIYARPFPGPGGQLQISTGGGTQVRWRRDGKEIFFVSLDGNLMAAAVKATPDQQSLEFGTPQALFITRIAGGPVNGLFKQNYAVSPDGQRFLVNVTAEESTTSPINVIYNWKPQAAK